MSAEKARSRAPCFRSFGELLRLVSDVDSGAAAGAFPNASVVKWTESREPFLDEGGRGEFLLGLEGGNHLDWRDGITGIAMRE